MEAVRWLKKKKRKILHLLITLVIESSPRLDLRQHLWIPYPADMETMGKISRERSLWSRIFSTMFLFLLLLNNTLSVSPVAQGLKRLPAMQETWVWSLDWEDPLEKEMPTHSCILAWRIPWTEEPGGLQSMGLQRVGHDWPSDLTKQYVKSFFIFYLM